MERPHTLSTDDARAVASSSPAADDGLSLWHLARRAGGLDVNSTYAYHLWCRDFADTSVVVRGPEGIVGFVTGYRPPARPAHLFVWQVAVDPTARGRGVGVAMLDDLATRHTDVRVVEASVTPSNVASSRMFERFAARWRAPVSRSELIGATELPGEHEAEVLLTIGPLDRSARP
jgi:L-2,4-diaminobutyric acid acetyltransferase